MSKKKVTQSERKRRQFQREHSQGVVYKELVGDSDSVKFIPCKDKFRVEDV